MILRRATADDAAALTICVAAAYAPFVHLGLPPVTEGIAEDIAMHHVWVAEQGDKVVGGIVLVLGDCAHIANLAVHPEAGGRGVGGALMARAVQAAGNAGYRKMRLATHVAMTATQAFYRRCGWTETGRDGNKVYFETELN